MTVGTTWVLDIFHCVLLRQTGPRAVCDAGDGSVVDTLPDDGGIIPGRYLYGLEDHEPDDRIEIRVGNGCCYCRDAAVGSDDLCWYVCLFIWPLFHVHSSVLFTVNLFFCFASACNGRYHSNQLV